MAESSNSLTTQKGLINTAITVGGIIGLVFLIGWAWKKGSAAGA